MSIERQSPRTAIRGWLESTERKPPEAEHTQGDVLHRRQRSKAMYTSPRKGSDMDPVMERVVTRNTYDNDPRKGADGEYDLKRKSQRHRVSPRTKIQTHTLATQGPDKRGIAEKIGLHAPFRNFEERRDDEDLDLDALTRSRKRRNRRSSIESYLEPANFPDQTEHDHGNYSPGEARRSQKACKPRPGDESGYLSESPVTYLPVHKEHKGSYVRRPRQKTREDRYELKEATTQKRQKKEKPSGKDLKVKKHKKHRRKEKSGAALMYDFSAQNVANNRLTLQPAKSLGLFGRGRASSPVRRKGLPDLTFSELSFLNSHRQRIEDVTMPSNTRRTEKSKRRKLDKEADTEAEISRFFTSKKVSNRNQPHHPPLHKRQDSRQESQNGDASPRFVELPSTPFLGFGSCGANSTSPAKRLGSPAMRDLEQMLDRSTSRSTSYLTWSQSDPCSRLSSPNEKHPVLPPGSLKVSKRNERSLAPPRSHLPDSPLASSDKQTNRPRKQHAKMSVTSDQDIHNGSSPSRSQASRIQLEHRDEIEHENDSRSAKSTAPPRNRNTRCSMEGALQDDLKNLLHFAPAASSANATLTRRPEPAVVVPLSPDREARQNMVPLDNALEALRDESRLRSHLVRSGPAEVTRSAQQNDAPRRVVTTTQIHQSQHDLSLEPSALTQAAPGAGSKGPTPLAASQCEPAEPYLRSISQKELVGAPRHVHVPHQPVNLGPPDTTDTPIEIPQITRRSHVDVQNAWNDYDNMYERQYLQIPAPTRRQEVLLDHRNESNIEFGLAQAHDSPSVYERPAYLSDWTDHHYHETTDAITFTNLDPEMEVDLQYNTWNNTEANVFAEDQRTYGTRNSVQGYVDDHQGYDIPVNSQSQSMFDGLEQHAPISFSSTQAFHRTSMPYSDHSSHHIISRTPLRLVGHSTDTRDTLNDTGPLGFWIPHKLY